MGRPGRSVSGGGVDRAVKPDPVELPVPVRLGLSFERMALALLFVAVAFRALLMPAQNDTFWHLRAGADIWRTGHVPRLDSYSFTAAGLPWPDHEWLWQALIYGCHRLGGMPLVSLVAAGFVVGFVALAYRMTMGPRITRFVLMAATLAPASCVWALRPQVVTLLALVLLVWLLARERYRMVPFLFLAWANLHGGVLFGGVVLVAALVAATLRWRRHRGPEDRRRLVALAVVSPLASVAICATPLGLGLFRFVWEGTSQAQIAWITEWQPTLPTGGLGAMFWAVAAVFVFIWIKRWRRLIDGPADTWFDWLIVASTWALFPFAFRALRNIPPFLMLAAPAASRLLGADFRFRLLRRGAPSPPSPDHPRLNLFLLGVVGAAAATIVAGAWMMAAKPLNWRPIGDHALAAVRACEGPLYNRYDEGGYLIWFAPEKKVFIDSRHDPYPLAFQQEVIAVQNGELSYRPLFQRWGIRCAFLPASSGMAARLRREGWESRFRDQAWDVLAWPTGLREEAAGAGSGLSRLERR
jgi:hypothetical protein